VHSLVDSAFSPDQEKVTLRMHELIQKIINVLIPIEEKKQRIEETIQILKPTFDDRTDKVVEKILKDNTPFLHALKISEEADKIDYHTPTLSSLRVRVLDVLVGIIRDFNKAKMINAYLQADFDKGVKLSKIDEILYNTNLFLFSFIYAPDFDKAITFGEKALSLIEPEEQLVEEKLRLFSNLIQYYSLAGLLDKAQKFVEKGKQYFPASQSNAYNALYVLAVATYHNERGEFEEVISLVESHSSLLEKQNAYPSMYSFTLNQLCEALVKKGKVSEAENMLNFTEKVGREFYSAEDNNFFAKLFANHAINKFSKKEQLTISKERLEKALHIYRKIYCGEDIPDNRDERNLLLPR